MGNGGRLMQNFYLSEDILKQINETNKIIKALGNAFYQQLSSVTDIYIKSASQLNVKPVSVPIPEIQAISTTQKVSELLSQINRNINPDKYLKFITNFQNYINNYKLLYYSDDNLVGEEINENAEINTKIITEIFKPDDEKNLTEESPIIILSPVNENVLKYLSENPQKFYHLSGTEFEIVMAEIYNRLGYKVELTKKTRDGGKDLIVRKPEILGDFIYYVECKKHAPTRPVGTGIIKNLVGTINADKVNGGILATTSYFSKDAKKFIKEYKYDYQIILQDYNIIRQLLDRVV